MSVENIKTDKELKGAYLTGERPLFHGKKLHIEQTIFNDGELVLCQDLVQGKMRNFSPF